MKMGGYPGKDVNDMIWEGNFKGAYERVQKINAPYYNGYKYSLNLQPDPFGYTPLHLIILKLDNRYTRDPREPQFLEMAFGIGVYDNDPKWSYEEYGQKLFLYLLDFEYLNRPTKYEETPLIIAASSNNVWCTQKLVDKLIRNRLTLNHKKTYAFPVANNRRFTGTALHGAVYANNVDIVQILLRGGIDITIENNDGQTALEYAESLGYVPIVNAIKVHKMESVRGITDDMPAAKFKF